MRAAALKGDCLVCQAPEPTRLALNGAIWSPEGARYTDYTARAKRVARGSEVPSLATLSRNAVVGHVSHIEDSWREVAAQGELVGREAPVTVPTDYMSATDPAIRVGVKAGRLLEHILDVAGDGGAALFKATDLIAMAKMGASTAGQREKTRLRVGQMQIDIAALFGLSAGHVGVLGAGAEADEILEVEDMRSALAAERKAIVSARDGA